MSLIVLFEDRGAVALPNAETKPASPDTSLDQEVGYGRQRWRELVQMILTNDATKDLPESL